MHEIVQDDLRVLSNGGRSSCIAINDHKHYQCGGGDVTALVRIHGMFELSCTCESLHHATRKLMPSRS